MRRMVAALALGVVAAVPAGCADDMYGRGAVSWSSYPYYGWYDNYYGSFYDGYWGTNGYFWFRRSPEAKRYRRDSARHFRRENMERDPRFRRFERTLAPPRRGTRMPNFPGPRHRRGG